MISHGNTMNFAVGAPRFLPPELVRRGYSCLTYNRRSHDILSTRDSRLPVGGAFQTAAADAADTAAAFSFLGGMEHERKVVIGHSNGGLLTAVLAAGRDDIDAVVLLSAHCGGPKIVQASCERGQLAGSQLHEVTGRASALVADGRENELMLVPGWWYVLSATSFLDRLEATPALLDTATQIQCPVLYLVGDEEPPDVYPARAFADAAGGPCDVVVIDDCDHFYRGREVAVARAVGEWLDATLPAVVPHDRLR